MTFLSISCFHLGLYEFIGISLLVCTDVRTLGSCPRGLVAGNEAVDCVDRVVGHSTTLSTLDLVVHQERWTLVRLFYGQLERIRPRGEHNTVFRDFRDENGDKSSAS